LQDVYPHVLTLHRLNHTLMCYRLSHNDS
jgi:hypothetical protein